MRDGPRILFLDQTGQLGGAELFLADVAARYRRMSEVILFQDGPFRQTLEQRGVSVVVHRLGEAAGTVSKASGLRAAVLAGPQLLQLVAGVALRARSFDLIYANTAKALIVGTLAAAIVGRPLLHHLHDILSSEHFSRFNRWLLVACANLARVVVANSRATANSFEESGGRRKLVRVVFNGFEAKRFEQCAARGDEDRRMLGVGDAPCALMVGRLTPWKGQHILLEALRQVPAIHAVFVGEALFTDEDRRYAEQLRSIASEPELVGRVHFAGFQTDVARWYGVADYVVHASTSAEPFGRVIVEGMLASKPVVASRAGGACEIIEEGVTGRLVAPGSADQLAAVLKDLLSDPKKAGALALAGYSSAVRRFSLEGVLEGIDSAVNEAIR